MNTNSNKNLSEQNTFSNNFLTYKDKSKNLIKSMQIGKALITIKTKPNNTKFDKDHNNTTKKVNSFKLEEDNNQDPNHAINQIDKKSRSVSKQLNNLELKKEKPKFRVTPKIDSKQEEGFKKQQEQLEKEKYATQRNGNKIRIDIRSLLADEKMNSSNESSEYNLMLSEKLKTQIYRKSPEQLTNSRT
jgi:hypothetical protein